MRNKIILYLAAWSLVFAGTALAAASGTGTTAGIFLKLHGGVRAAAMGDAFVAVADDPSALYWNPAGLGQIKSAELSSTYSSWFDGSSFTSLALVRPLYPGHSSGIMFNNLDAGAIEETTLSQPGGTGRIFSPFAMTTTLAYCRRLNPVLSLGFSGKYLREDIDASSMRGYAFDLGALFRLSKKLSFGFTIKNIGTFHGIDNALPLDYRTGISLRPTEALLLAADLDLPNDNRPTFHLGTEYGFNQLFCGRIGYNSRAEDNAGGNFSLGTGIRWKGIKFDYAYLPFGDLGDTHRISFGLSF